jgi:hypothetical protein
MVGNACEMKLACGVSAKKRQNGGGVNVMRGGLRYQVVVAANSLIGSVVLWAVLLAMGGIAATVLLR